MPGRPGGAETLRWARKGVRRMTVGRGLRRARVTGGRPHSVCVRMTDEEFAYISARAANARLSVAALLAVNALTAEDQPVIDPGRLRAMVIELYAVRRGMSNAGRNINDVARFALGTGALKENTDLSVREFRAAVARLDGFLSVLAQYLPGVNLKDVDW